MSGQKQIEIRCKIWKKQIEISVDKVIFDEVQFFPKARQSIKQLVKDGRFDYIETGSLISIQKNVKDILIPSEENSFNAVKKILPV